jgi:predicted TIM-barrel fold metal-dependent hydrolase
MSTVGISKSILSISSPGTSLYCLADDSARFTRRCNNYAASLKRDYPTKFGFWASLPLPFISESLQEIEIALAEGADGFTLMTNYQGRYLGDPTLNPVFDLLNEKRARIFIHPTMPCIQGQSGRQPQDGSNFWTNSDTLDSPYVFTPSGHHPATPLLALYPIPMFEFFFDTARATCDLLLRGVLSKRHDLSIILPHAAGCFPPLVSRIALFSSHIKDAFPLDGSILPLGEDEIRELLNTQFYFDLAGAIFPGQLKAMLIILGVQSDRLVYGSDFPFTPAGGVISLAAKMDEALLELVGQQGRQNIYSENAAKMLRRK